MSIPYSAGQLVAAINSNEFDIDSYNVARGIQFNEDLREIADFATFTTFIDNKYNTAIEMTSVVATPQGYKGPVRCERISKGKLETVTEKFVLDNEYAYTVPLCKENGMRTILGVPTLLSEADVQLDIDMTHELNKDAYALAFASVSLSIPAVTDVTSAKFAIRAVRNAYSKYQNTAKFDIVAHIPVDLQVHFDSIIEATTYKLKDDLMTYGTIGRIQDVSLVNMDDSILGASEQGRVLFTVGKPLSFYHDGSMTELATYEAGKSVSTVYHTSNMIREIRTVGQFIMWDKDKKFVAGTLA